MMGTLGGYFMGSNFVESREAKRARARAWAAKINRGGRRKKGKRGR